MCECVRLLVQFVEFKGLLVCLGRLLEYVSGARSVLCSAGLRCRILKYSHLCIVQPAWTHPRGPLSTPAVPEACNFPSVCLLLFLRPQRPFARNDILYHVSAIAVTS